MHEAALPRQGRSVVQGTKKSVPGHLSLQIRKRLTDDKPFAYCDACHALRLHQSLEDTRAAAMLLVREDGFMRKVRACYGCNRAVEMTEVTR